MKIDASIRKVDERFSECDTQWRTDMKIFERPIKIFFSLFVVAFICLCFQSSVVKADSLKSDVIVSDQSNLISKSISRENKEFLNKLTKVLMYFKIDFQGTLYLDLSKEELKEIYQFTDVECEKVEQLIAFSKMTKQRYTDRVTVSDWKIYFTHPEVQQFLLAAAQAGPVAMTAALGTVVATPGIGTVIGAMIGAFGGR